LDHQIILEAIAEHIHDGRFLKLIERLLQAGYLEEWKYNSTMSGAPQGGIISPILSNIYLNKLDKYIEETLIPAYTQGERREENREYRNLLNEAAKLRREGKHEEANKVRTRAQQLPSGNPNDPNFRRLHYCRYADDWLLGFIGPRTEAEEIKRQVGQFLREQLKLELSEEKTLITHARTEKARFLGYHISTMQNDTYRPKKIRRINGQIEMSIPQDILMEKCQSYMRYGKPMHKMILIDDTIYSIMAQYQSEYRGFVEYYQLANDIHRCSLLKWVMGISLTKTLAKKLKRTVKQVRKKYAATITVNKAPYKVLQVIVPRDAHVGLHPPG